MIADISLVAEHGSSWPEGADFVRCNESPAGFVYQEDTGRAANVVARQPVILSRHSHSTDPLCDALSCRFRRACDVQSKQGVAAAI
jgi:hypothetical protein